MNVVAVRAVLVGCLESDGFRSVGISVVYIQLCDLFAVFISGLVVIEYVEGIAVIQLAYDMSINVERMS